MLTKLNIKRSTRSQVTIFIIIALIIVGLIIGYFLLRGKTNIAETQGISKVPSQIQPVYTYTSDYLKQKTLDGLEILRLQGGYIYIPNNVEVIEITTNGSHIENSGQNIKLIKTTGKTKIPVWLNKNSMAVPSISFMENQLSTYLQTEMWKLDFSEYENKGMKISREKPNISVSMKDYVNIVAKYHININYKEQSYELEDFSYIRRINFTQLYYVASSMLIYEIGYNYLEGHAKSLISLYSYAGGKKVERDLPPTSFTDTNLDCSFITWTKDEIESDLKSIFSENYAYLKIDKTNFVKVKAKDAMSQGVYDSFIKNYLPEMKNIHVDFSYQPDSALELATNPESLIPERISQGKIPFLPSFCSFSYEFAYTIATPIVTKIKNDNDEKIAKEGYEFYFPMKLWICNDGARKCTEQQNESFNMNQVENITGTKFYDCKNSISEKTISVTDENGNSLDGVDITHYCSGFVNNCWLGRTLQGKVNINIPICESSTLELSKEGYGKLKSTVKDSYALDKLENYSVSVRVVDARKFAANYYSSSGFTKGACGKTPKQLLDESSYSTSANDKALIYISGGETTVISYPQDKNILISSGSYDITSTLNSRVTIKPSTYEGKTLSFNQKNQNQAYVGDWMLGTSSLSTEISSAEISGKTKVTFYVLAEHLATENLEVKDFENPILNEDGLSGKVKTCSNEEVDVNISKRDYAEFIKPKFS